MPKERTLVKAPMTAIPFLFLPSLGHAEGA